MANGPTSTNVNTNSQSVFQAAKQKLADLIRLDQEAKNEFAAIDTDHNGAISKDELIASQTEGVTDPRERAKLAETWGQVFEAAAGKDGALNADQFANLVSVFTGHGLDGVKYETRQEARAHDPVSSDQHTVVQNVSQRIEELNAQKAQLFRDLSDPKKAPEAAARLHLLGRQINELTNVRQQIESFKPGSHLSGEGKKATSEILARMNGLIMDLSNPTKAMDAHSQLITLSALLRQPELYDPKNPDLTSDLTLRNRGIVDRNLSERIGQLQAQQNNFIGDLSDPRKAPGAKARIDLIDRQISDLKGLQNAIDAYHRPSGLSGNDEKATNDMLARINDLSGDLSDPAKAAGAHAQITTLTSLLHNPGLYDPNSPHLTNDPVIVNQSIVSQNLNQRLQDLVAQKNNLVADLSDPSKRPEAEARLQLLNKQIGDVSHLLRIVDDYRRPGNLNAEDVNKSADMFAKINDLTANLSDPKLEAEAHGKMVALGSLLHNPSLFDPSSPSLTNDPAIKNQEIAAQNASQRMADLIGVANNLIGDLKDPAKAAEAQARLGLINQQLAEVAHVRNTIEGYRRPGKLDQAQINQVADTFAKLNQLTADLSDPMKAPEAQAKLTELNNQLHNPGLKNDPVVKNQVITVQNLSQRIQDLIGQKNMLIGDLSDPTKSAEAQARLQLLDSQIQQLGMVRGMVQSYVRPGNLTPNQDARSADLMGQIDHLAADLSDPSKHAEALTQVSNLMDKLKNPMLLD